MTGDIGDTFGVAVRPVERRERVLTPAGRMPRYRATGTPETGWLAVRVDAKGAAIVRA